MLCGDYLPTMVSSPDITNLILWKRISIPPKTEWGYLQGGVIENDRTRNPLTLCRVHWPSEYSSQEHYNNSHSGQGPTVFVPNLFQLACQLALFSFVLFGQFRFYMWFKLFWIAASSKIYRTRSHMIKKSNLQIRYWSNQRGILIAWANIPAN